MVIVYFFMNLLDLHFFEIVVDSAQTDHVILWHAVALFLF